MVKEAQLFIRRIELWRTFCHNFFGLSKMGIKLWRQLQIIIQQYIIWNKKRDLYVAGNFFPTACTLIGYFEDTWRLTMKLFPAKIYEQATLQNLWQQSKGNIPLLPANADRQAPFNSNVYEFLGK